MAASYLPHEFGDGAELMRADPAEKREVWRMFDETASLAVTVYALAPVGRL